MQKETFIKFFDNSDGSYFRLKSGGNVIAQESKIDDKAASKAAISDAFDNLVLLGEKVELTVSKSSNFTGGVTLSRHNTASGQFEKPQPQTPAGFQGNESSFMQGWTQGYAQGENAGRMMAQLEQLRIQAETPAKPNILEGLTQTEQGHAILAALAAKLGVL